MADTLNPVTAVDHFKAGNAALMKAYTALGANGGDMDGVAFAWAGVAQAHYLAASAINSGIDAKDLDERNAWRGWAGAGLGADQ